jgi:hypothetical protein
MNIGTRVPSLLVKKSCVVSKGASALSACASLNATDVRVSRS